MKQEFVKYAREEAKKWGLPDGLVEQVMRQESGGNPKAVSEAGAIGLMQLMPGTAKGLGVNPYDPYQNIKGGVTYLGRNYKTYGGDVAKTLASYNAGPGAVAKYKGVPPYAETQNYVKNIMSRMGTETGSSGITQIGGGSNVAVPTKIEKMGLGKLVGVDAVPDITIPQLKKLPTKPTILFDEDTIRKNYQNRLNKNATQFSIVPTQGNFSDKLGDRLLVGGQYNPKVEANLFDRVLNEKGQAITDFNQAKDYISANKHVVRNNVLGGLGLGAGLGTIVLPGVGTVLGGAIGAGLGAGRGSRELNALASKAVKGANVADNLVSREIQNARVQADTAKRVNEANVRAGGVDETNNLRSAFNQVGLTTDSQGIVPLLQNAFSQGNQGRSNQLALLNEKITQTVSAINQAKSVGNAKLADDLNKQLSLYNNQASLLQGSTAGAIAQGHGEGLGTLNQTLNTSVDLNKMSNQSALAQALANTDSRTQLGVAGINKDAQLGVAGLGLEGQRLALEAQKEMAQLPFKIGKELIGETNTRTSAIRNALQEKDIPQLMALDPTLTREQAYRGIMQYHMRNVPVLGGMFGGLTDLVLPGSSSNLDKIQSNMSPYQSNATLLQLLGGSK